MSSQLRLAIKLALDDIGIHVDNVYNFGLVSAQGANPLLSHSVFLLFPLTYFSASVVQELCKFEIISSRVPQLPKLLFASRYR